MNRVTVAALSNLAVEIFALHKRKVDS